jgi:hypothetical protein
MADQSDAFHDAVSSLAKDSEARTRLRSDPNAFFADYPKLTDDEKATLRQLAPAATSDGGSSPWKQWGALGLSVVTIVFFGLAVGLIIANINTPPVYTVIPNTTPPQNDSFQPWDRVQVFFNAMLPLFGALFSYWLGVTVEGKRADQAEQAASAAKSETETEKKKTEALLAASNPQIIDAARQRYPGLFPTQSVTPSPTASPSQPSTQA